MHIIYSENDINKDLWSGFVNNHPNGNIFQTPEYYSSLKNTKKSDSVIVAVMDDRDSEILGLLVAVVYYEGKGLKGYFSRRSIAMGAPLVKNNDPSILNDLISAYNKFIKSKAIYSQFRNMFSMSEYEHIFKKCGYEYEQHLNILIDLNKSREELWSGVHSKRRNEIRKAEKKGLTVKKLEGIQQLREAYKILESVYSNAGLPIMEPDSFEKVYNEMSHKNYFRMFGVFKEDKLAGTMMVFVYKERIYDWYAGSLKEYYDCYPNDLLPWQVFNISKSDGLEIFDFGGAGKPDVHYGVRDYKKQFGGEMVEFGRYTLLHKPILYKLGIYLLKGYKLLKYGLRTRK